MRKFYLSLLLLWLAEPAQPTTYIPQSFEFYYRSAEIVARITITRAEIVEGQFEGRAINCGARYKAHVVESFKGDELSFEFVSTDETFQLGEDYLVFVYGAENAKTPIMSSSRISDGGGIMDATRDCRERIEGRRANWLASSRFIATTKDVTSGKLIEWITPPYNIIKTDNVIHKKMSVKTIEIDGEDVTSSYWYMSEHPVPHDITFFDGAVQWDGYRFDLLKAIEAVKSEKIQPSAGEIKE